MVIEYVSSVKAAWELAKAIKASTDAIDDAQMKYQAAELIAALADARIQASESAERIAFLESQLKAKAELKFNGNVYYKIVDGEEPEGPWCPTCRDARGLEIRLQTYQNARDRQLAWQCRECQGHFER
jgi:DNA repair exonuclease SbcCD ATPase subunit